MHFPAVRAATRSHLNPCAENFAMYHGFSPALRSNTRPPIFIALLIARISCIQIVECSAECSQAQSSTGIHSD